MRGDFSRTTFRPQHHYSGVRLQQGRVQLDAEFNEHVDIEAYRDEALTRDVVGVNGVPYEGGGFQIGAGSNLRDIDASGSALWAVGEDGTVLKAAPGTQPWALQAIPAGAGHLNALSLTAADQGWLVGEGGKAKAFELTSAEPDVWQPRPLPSGSNVDLNDVVVVGSNVWVVGAAGTILHWDGAQWKRHKVAGVNVTLRGIHFSGANGWIVGDNGTLLTTKAPTGPWKVHNASKIDTNLRSVSLPSATTGWAVGDGGAIYAWDNADSRWKRQTAPVGTNETLRGVDFLAGTTNGTIVGDEGTILVTANGTDWSRETALSRAHLRSVRVTSATEALAAGDNAALSRKGGAWANTSQALPATGRNVTISAGDMYVDGLRIENERDVSFTNQPDQRELLPKLGNANARDFGFYVQIQEQLLTALEREHLREVALGGPDTATRTRTVWQVKAVQMTVGSSCADLETLLTTKTGQLGGARLRARAELAPLTTNECVVPPTGGYRRLENQLYRVEIHNASDDPNGPTYKWSRENGSVIARLEAISRSAADPATGSVTVFSVGRDEVLGFAVDDLIEVTDETRLLAGVPGLMLEVTGVNGNVLVVKGFTGGGQPSLATFPLNPIVRRWEGQGAAVADGWVDLEDGVQVQFAYVGEQSEAFRTGDHWTIPARTATGNVEWPRAGGVAAFEAPRGPRARLAALGVARLDKTGWSVLHDCRRRFPPLTGLIQMEYVGGDGQEAVPDPLAPAAQLYPLARPLEVGVSNWRWPVEGAKVRFTLAAGGGSLSGDGQTDSSIVVVTTAEGIAACSWSLDGTTQSQQVEARLLDENEDPVEPPIHFNANLSRATHVAYDPAGCANLVKAKTNTVQKAVEHVVARARLVKVSGDAQEVLPGEELDQLTVRVDNHCGPIREAQVRFVTAFGTLTGAETGSEVTETTDAQGIAGVGWTLDDTTDTQYVEVEIVDDGNGPPPAPAPRVVFSARLSRADHVSYRPPPKCDMLENADTVQSALDVLAGRIPRLYHVSGDGLEGPTGTTVLLRAGIANLCGISEPRVRFELETAGDFVEQAVVDPDPEGVASYTHTIASERQLLRAELLDDEGKTAGDPVYFTVGPAAGETRPRLEVRSVDLRVGSPRRLVPNREIDVELIGRGLVVTFGDQVDPKIGAGARGRNVLSLVVERPFPLTPREQQEWETAGTVGYVRLSVAGNIDPGGDRILWVPTPEAHAFLSERLMPLVRERGEALRTWVVIEGGLIWAPADEAGDVAHADAEVMRLPAKPEVSYGDGAPGGTGALPFWLT
jgi:photosystem II stability/assembly factor-like uncharacterized protein